jgi:ATP-dependent helicase/nuclease subunit B
VRIAAFPPSAAFLPALATAWLAEAAPSQEGLIILPSRRAAQALAGAFLAANHHKALLLPRIIALGAIDEAGLAIGAGLSLAPAMPAARRQALLARLILQRGGAGGAPTTLPAAWRLAADLAALLDEADYAGIDLAQTLPGLAPAELAAHWQTTLAFLEIITQAWPAILAQERAMNPAARLVALISAQNAAWQAEPPPHRIWLAAPDANPALARLAKTIATMPQGMLLLPGYDNLMSDDAWAALDDSHAQSGIAQLLTAIGARRSEITLLPAPAADIPAGRPALLSRALLPASQLPEWQEPAALDTAGLTGLTAADEAQNALAIAMVLRDALEQPGRTAALITPDRGLAQRVAAALKRFGVTADDSAGEPLEQTPPAIFLRLLARAAAADVAPLPLLALLQHPLTAAGLPPAICRERARQLDRLALRGPRPGPGFDGIKFRLRDPRQRGLLDFAEHLEVLLRPLNLAEASNPADALSTLITVAEALATTPDAPGAASLWAGEAGVALSALLLEAMAALAELPDIAPQELPDLLDALLTGAVIRRPRTKDGHPRIAIWGIQEAALQRVDVAVLGGLVEGVWPAAAEPGPWLSRPMRKAAGLPAPEAAIGAAAHSLFALGCACTEIVLAAPARRERAPAVPARWLTRMDAMLAGAGQTLPTHPAAQWAAALDAPATPERRTPPRPTPPVAARPRRLSISEFATLLADPFAIYAKKILNLNPLDPLDDERDPAMFGDILHAGLAAFFADPANFSLPDPVSRLTNALDAALQASQPREALKSWWSARLARIAAWVVETEQASRAISGPPAAISLEHKAEHAIPGGFTLSGIVDRIEATPTGEIRILDYKSGIVPSAKAVAAGTAPQLPLEAVMAQSGGFGSAFTGPIAALTYWKLDGRHQPGKIHDIKPKDTTLAALITAAAASLADNFTRFADPATPYLAAPHPGRANRYDAYAGISRRAEWAGVEDEEEEDDE